MRLAIYGIASTLAASTVVLSAFAQRANLYSAMVYLAQSNACLMVLTNFALLLSLIVAHGLQRLLYGRLRDLEVESLYEKAWYAVTETCLAMTIFRDEWNVGFVVCFAGLLFAKAFCWLSAGRVEMMEQTPPANPKLFHARLISSLAMLILSDIAMIYYAVSVVLEKGRPNMMVMFAFEFTILLISAIGTTGRYGLIMTEKAIVRKQIEMRRAARRRERELAAESEATQAPLEEDDDMDDMEGLVWEEKGTWLFYLELGTDFLKLLTYLAFFMIVLTFYGLPLHIIRDVYLTLRSFISRIRDFIRYRRATNDMHARYPDATPEEVERENVCIICREEMRPFIVPDQEAENAVGGEAAGGAAARIGAQQQARMRPKKLPCGHILHFACLRSWLERQQRCPTCRRPVLENTQGNDPTNPNNRPGQAGGQQGPGGGMAWRGQFGVGGIRVNFGVGQGPEFMEQFVGQFGMHPGAAGVGGGLGQHQQQNQQQQGHPMAGVLHQAQQQQAQQQTQIQTQTQPTVGIASLTHLHNQLLELERNLRRELEAVERTSAQVSVVMDLQDSLSRQQAQSVARSQDAASTVAPSTVSIESRPTPISSANSHTPRSLPPGVHLPPGWNIIPLSPGAVLPANSTATPEGSQIVPPPVSSNSGAPSLSIESLRRRRFGRGDVRSYATNLRNWHAARSPRVERDEASGGLAGASSPSQSRSTLFRDSLENNADTNGELSCSQPTELQKRVISLLQHTIAIEESTSILNSVLEALRGVADSHALTNRAGLGTEEEIEQAEREVRDAEKTRRGLMEEVKRMMGEAERLLDLESAHIEEGKIAGPSSEGEKANDRDGGNMMKEPREEYSGGEVNTEEEGLQDKGKGRAAEVEEILE